MRHLLSKQWESTSTSYPVHHIASLASYSVKRGRRERENCCFPCFVGVAYMMIASLITFARVKNGCLICYLIQTNMVVGWCSRNLRHFIVTHVQLRGCSQVCQSLPVVTFARALRPSGGTSTTVSQGLGYGLFLVSPMSYLCHRTVSVSVAFDRVGRNSRLAGAWSAPGKFQGGLCCTPPFNLV